MFVQLIEGRVSDADGLRRQLDKWNAELKAGADGYLGATGGVTDDGRVIFAARFDSAEAAEANSARPEQGEWWSETERSFDGEVTFTDSDDVETYLRGGSNDAGFVQVMKSKDVDREQVHALDAIFTSVADTFRPDLIGGLRVWTGPTESTELAYFTSEAEARANEKKDPPPEFADQMAQFEQMMANTEFIDLRNPWLF